MSINFSDKLRPEELDLEPFFHNVLVKIIVDKQTKSTIVLTSETLKKEASTEVLAEVVEIGPLACSDIGDRQPPYKVGDLVILELFKGGEKKTEDETKFCAYRWVDDTSIKCGVRRWGDYKSPKYLAKEVK